MDELIKKFTEWIQGLVKMELSEAVKGEVDRKIVEDIVDARFKDLFDDHFNESIRNVDFDISIDDVSLEVNNASITVN